MNALLEKRIKHWFDTWENWPDDLFPRGETHELMYEVILALEEAEDLLCSYHGRCPICGAETDQGMMHKPDCRLGAFLGWPHCIKFKEQANEPLAKSPN